MPSSSSAVPRRALRKGHLKVADAPGPSCEALPAGLCTSLAAIGGRFDSSAYIRTHLMLTRESGNHGLVFSIRKVTSKGEPVSTASELYAGIGRSDHTA